MVKYFTDEQLASFVDGEADSTLSDMISQEMQRSDELKAQIQDISDTIGSIKHAFDSQEDDTPSFHLPEKEVPKVLPNILVFALRPAYLASFASFCLMFGVAFVFWQSGSRASNLSERFAQVHHEQSFASVDTWNVGLESDREKFAKLSYFSSHVGLDLTRLMGVKELHFIWARFLNVDEQVAIQLSFLSNSGDEISLYLLKDPASFTDNPVSEITSGLDITKWRNEDLGLILIQSASNDFGSAADKKLENLKMVQLLAEQFIISRASTTSRTMI